MRKPPRYLTDLRGVATHQFRKAWVRNALGSVAWEDLHRDPNPLDAAAYWCKPWNPPKRPLTDLVLNMCHKVYLFATPSGFPSLWLSLAVRKQLRMLCACLQGNLCSVTFSSRAVNLSLPKSCKLVRFFKKVLNGKLYSTQSYSWSFTDQGPVNR